MPTSGTNRPGPLGGLPASAPTGVKPIHITIERLGIAAEIEAITFADELPVLTETPETVAWYPRSTPLAVPGVMLIGGSSAIGEAGPSAFTRLSEVEPGDIAIVTGANGGAFHFEIDRSEAMAELPDFTEMLREMTEERIVLLAWAGVFPGSAANGGLHMVAGVRVVATLPAG